MEVSRLGIELELQLWPMLQPQQHWIQAASAAYIAARGTTRSLTHWGIKPSSSWILVGFLTHWATMETPNSRSLTHCAGLGIEMRPSTPERLLVLLCTDLFAVMHSNTPRPKDRTVSGRPFGVPRSLWDGAVGGRSIRMIDGLWEAGRIGTSWARDLDQSIIPSVSLFLFVKWIIFTYLFHKVVRRIKYESAYEVYEMNKLLLR